MIAKETKKVGSAAPGLCYILGGSKDEPQHVEIVTCSGITIPRRARRVIERIENSMAGKASRKKEIRKIASALAIPFDLRAGKAGPKVNMPNQGYIIGFAQEDREKLTPEQKQQILEEFLQKIGVHGDISVRRRRHGKTLYEKVHRDAMFIAVGHTETRCYHIHIFASRIDSSGRANETSFEHRRIVKACAEISKKYGIRMDALQDAEVNRENVNPGYYNKVQVRKFIKEAKSTARTWEEFEEKLISRKIFVEVKNKAEHGKDGVCFRYIVGLGKKVEMRSHTYSGTQLANELTLPKIQQAIEANTLQYQKEAVTNKGQHVSAAPVDSEKPMRGLNIKAAFQKASKTSHQYADMKRIDPKDILEVFMNAKDKNAFALARIQKRMLIEPLKDEYGGVLDFKVVIAADGYEFRASDIVTHEQLNIMLTKWETIGDEQSARTLQKNRENMNDLKEICAKIDMALPNNAPRVPQNIEYLRNGEKKVSYTMRNSRRYTVLVDVNGRIQFDNGYVDTVTGKYNKNNGIQQARSKPVGKQLKIK